MNYQRETFSEYIRATLPERVLITVVSVLIAEVIIWLTNARDPAPFWIGFGVCAFLTAIFVRWPYR